MNRNAKIALGALALGLGGLALSRKASAGDGRFPIDPPVGPGGEQPTEPVNPGFVEPPPAKPPANVKNYVGSGYNWPDRARYPQPVHIGIALQRLGYPVSFADNGDTPHTRPFNMISTQNMIVVREFQRDYNAAAKAQTVDDPAKPGALDDDGLVGKNTLAAITNAERWVSVLGLPWSSIVALAA